MSHIRSDLNADDCLYQSQGAPLLSHASGTTTDPPAAAPAGATWRGAFRAVAAVLREWRARQRARRDLAAIDARTLRDVGISPELVNFELSQPFWRPLRDWRD
jgi:uncharacterized protein YjiS (DUF1127 family)